jgi:hypothetical protein
MKRKENRIRSDIREKEKIKQKKTVTRRGRRKHTNGTGG